MDLDFWDGVLSPTEREVIVRGGYGRRHDLGDRPALLLIDFQYNYAGENKPILEQIDRHRSGVGEAAWRAAETVRGLIPTARTASVPLIYTMVRQRKSVIAGRETPWGMIHTLERPAAFMTEGDPGSRIIEELRPDENAGDLVLEKNYPSAFFATPLATYLIRLGVNTVFLSGGTTSGCVRATAVDASSLGLRVGIIADCVFDRIHISHMTSLLDVWMKYGTILTSQEFFAYLKKLELSKSSGDDTADRGPRGAALT